jgi:hypothetical protein
MPQQTEFKTVNAYLIATTLSTGCRKVTQPILKYLLMVAFQYSSIGFINKSPRGSRHVVTCSRQSVSCLHSRSTRMSFLQVQRVFIVEHYLASRSYLACQNEFMDTFPDSPVPNKSTMSRLVNRFCDTGTLHWVASNMRKRVNACIVKHGGHF